MLDRYTLQPMKVLWHPQAKFQFWHNVECAWLRARVDFGELPQEAHKLGSSSHTLAINLAQFLRLTLANWLSSSSTTTTSFGACGVSSFFIHPSCRRMVAEIAP